MSKQTSISLRMSLGFDECLGLLRQKLRREQFRVVTQVQFDREFENTLGVHWRKYTVLVVWNSFYAYQALLSGVDAGLLLPFNVSVSEDAGSTLISTTSPAPDSQGPVGVRILTHELTRKMEQILMEFAVYDTTGGRSLIPMGAGEAV